MYIEPNSTVIVLRDVPLDKDYQHTIGWTGGSQISAQTAYFQGKKKYQYDKLTYQRVGRGTIRVEQLADELYDCNYLMFRNTAYGTKWFYAFLDRVTYINDVCTEIHYTIDVIQTWFFETIPDMCYVVREHPRSDKIGENLVPETLETGDYVEDGEGQDAQASLNLSRHLSIIMAVSYDMDTGQDAQGLFYNGIYSGLLYKTFSTASAANAYLKRAAEEGKADSIIAIFMAPSSAMQAGTNTQPNEISTYGTYVHQSNIHQPLDGYQPKCNKLYTYPYNFIKVSNLEGKTAAYRNEWFVNPDTATTRHFYIYTTYGPSMEACLVPTYYRNNNINFEEKITITGWPLCAWTTNAWSQWIARNWPSQVGGAISMLTEPARIAKGMFDDMGNARIVNTLFGYEEQNSPDLFTPIVDTIDWAGKALSWGNTMYSHAITPPQSHGNQGSSIGVSTQSKGFYVTNCHVNAEMAEIIDNYFWAFGYACHKIKVPDISGRPYWNYIKTEGYHCGGYIPGDDKVAIASIYDKGITFWHDPNRVGDYTQDNSV